CTRPGGRAALAWTSSSPLVCRPLLPERRIAQALHVRRLHENCVRVRRLMIEGMVVPDGLDEGRVSDRPSRHEPRKTRKTRKRSVLGISWSIGLCVLRFLVFRSEERRVGKAC